MEVAIVNVERVATIIRITRTKPVKTKSRNRDYPIAAFEIGTGL